MVAEDNPDDFALFERAAHKCGISAAIHHVTDGGQAIDYLHGVGAFADREKYPLPKIMVLDLKDAPCEWIRFLIVADEPRDSSLSPGVGSFFFT